MNEFTPGPWTSQPYKRGTTRYRIIQNPYGLIAEVVVGNPANPRVNTEADANLIAAAPELLTELQSMRQRFVRCLEHSGTDPEYAFAAVASTDAVIAKALKGT